jgi:hypothetical protein
LIWSPRNSCYIVIYNTNLLTLSLCCQDMVNDTINVREAIYKEIMQYHDTETRAHTLSFNAILRPASRTDRTAATTTTAHTATEQLMQQPDQQQKPFAADGELKLEPSHIQQFVRQLSGGAASVTGEATVKGETIVTGETIAQQLEDGSDVDNVFRRPGDVRKADIGAVTVDTTRGLHAPCTDVEMLSAKLSTPGDPLTDLGAKTQDNKENTTENKTVSMDTKALIKAALLNSSLKKKRNGRCMFFISQCLPPAVVGLKAYISKILCCEGGCVCTLLY